MVSGILPETTVGKHNPPDVVLFCENEKVKKWHETTLQ